MSTHKKNFIKRIEALHNPERAIGQAKFFQCFPGGYGEGDTFYALAVPDERKLSKEFYKLLTLDELTELLKNPVHDIRITTLMMLVLRYEKSKDTQEQQAIVDIYWNHMDYVNNWDLVDTSAHKILGAWFYDKPRKPLIKLSEEDHLWKQRISMIATAYFIGKSDYETTLIIAEKLMHHKHDLIHKAVGWMLREIGNRDYQTEFDFLKFHYKTMPRTMLRYAIEKFDEDVRQGFLKGTI
jgi:3-methyladenine DNA glycosylase AlkD